jgi:hypothetical protein
MKAKHPVLVIALAAAFAGPALEAIAAPGDTVTVLERQPTSTSHDRPFSSQAPVSSNGAHRASSVMRTTASAVNRATYRQEKAAATRGPAPMGATPVRFPRSAAPLAASVPLSFNGLDRPSAVNNGLVFNPPDTVVGKSPNRVLEGVNSALRLFGNTGGIIGTSNLNTFFGAATTNGLLFDPKVYYDRNATNPRFFVVALQVAGRDNTNTADDISRIWVAVSRSPDPASLASSNWCRYNIDSRRNVGTTQVSWADYPAIGAGRDSFSFALNQFRFTDRAFTFAVVHVWNKTTAENNAASCPTVPRFTFQPSATAGDFSRFTVQPVQHYTSPSSFTGTTNPAYYLSTRRGTSTEYRVYRVRNVASGSPTMAQLTLTGASYGIPPSSPQPGSTVMVDTGDNRMLQAAGIGNRLQGIFSTVCNFTSGTPNESCTRAPAVTVGQSSTGGLTASLVENTFAGFRDNIFVHHPSIAMNSALQSGATWEFSGSANSLSSAAMTKNAGGAWTGVQTYAPGACSQSQSRAGDYAGAQTDPSNLNSFWLAGEQSVTIGTSCQWRTRIASLVP